MEMRLSQTQVQRELNVNIHLGQSERRKKKRERVLYGISGTPASSFLMHLLFNTGLLALLSVLFVKWTQPG